MAKFKPGQSGNPAGKPKGARNKATMAALELLDGESEALTRKAIDLALGRGAEGQPGKDADLAALRLCIERIAPVRRDAPIEFDLPELKTGEDAKEAMAAILKGVAGGELAPSHAAELSKMVENFVRACELSEIEKRLSALEGERAI